MDNTLKILKDETELILNGLYSLLVSGKGSSDTHRQIARLEDQLERIESAIISSEIREMTA